MALISTSRLTAPARSDEGGPGLLDLDIWNPTGSRSHIHPRKWEPPRPKTGNPARHTCARGGRQADHRHTHKHAYPHTGGGGGGREREEEEDEEEEEEEEEKEEKEED